MVWNYHDEDKQDRGEVIKVNVANIPSKKITLTEYRIDDQYSNSYEVWKKMGSPQNPSAKQVAELEKAGQLQTIGKKRKLKTVSGRTTVTISLPRQGVALLKMDW
jgi:xylan 1,4-beta-xylosidase